MAFSKPSRDTYRNFSDIQYQRVEDAADQAVLALFREACPRMPQSEMDALWNHLVVTESRGKAREMLEQYLKFNLFDEDGNVRDFKVEDGIE